jgi:hypothetical protein
VTKFTSPDRISSLLGTITLGWAHYTLAGRLSHLLGELFTPVGRAAAFWARNCVPEVNLICEEAAASSPTNCCIKQQSYRPVYHSKICCLSLSFTGSLE